jgi:hypothetical protein
LKKVNSKTASNKLGLILIVILFWVIGAHGQPSLPTRSIEVVATQPLHFGTFVDTGTGGNVAVGWDGNRTASGSIVLLNFAPYAQPAIFEIELLQGRNVHIDFSASTTLTGNHGGSLKLIVGPTEKGNNGAFFPTSNDRKFITTLRVGGTLDIPIATIPGTYTGNFYITFNQE